MSTDEKKEMGVDISKNICANLAVFICANLCKSYLIDRVLWSIN